jgi:hypothetical protein
MFQYFSIISCSLKIGLVCKHSYYIYYRQIPFFLLCIPKCSHFFMVKYFYLSLLFSNIKITSPHPPPPLFPPPLNCTSCIRVGLFGFYHFLLIFFISLSKSDKYFSSCTILNCSYSLCAFSIACS